MAQQIFHKQWLTRLSIYSPQLFPFYFHQNTTLANKHYEMFKKESDYLSQFLNQLYRLGNKKLFKQVLTDELIKYKNITSDEQKIQILRQFAAISFSISSQQGRRSKALIEYWNENLNFVDNFLNEFKQKKKNKLILVLLLRTIQSLEIQNKLLVEIEKLNDRNLIVFVLKYLSTKQSLDYKIRLQENDRNIIEIICQKYNQDVEIKQLLYELYVDQDLM